MNDEHVREVRSKMANEIVRGYLEKLKSFEQETFKAKTDLEEQQYYYYHRDVNEEIYKLHNALKSHIDFFDNYTKGKHPITVYLNQAELGRLKVIKGEESEYECLRRLIKEALKE